MSLDRAKALHEAGNLKEAERLYVATLRHDAANAEALHRLSILNAQLGRFEPALKFAERALALSPGSSELHFHRGELHCAGRQHERALESYRAAIALRPEYVAAINNLGDTLLVLGRAQEALAQFERVLGLSPSHVEALNNRGNALQALGRCDDALRSFGEALAASPGNADILSNRASTLLSLERNGEAEADCRRALASRPGHGHALTNLAKAQFHRGMVEEAAATIAQAIAAKPDSAEAWVEQGVVLAALRRHQDAWNSYDRALKLAPDLVNAWIGSGVLYSQVAKYDAAVKCYRRALALRPQNALAFFDLGHSLRALRRTKEARLAFDEAFKLDPGFEEARGQATHLKRQLCDWGDMADDFALLVTDVRAGKCAVNPVDFLVMSDCAQDQLRCAQIFAHRHYPAQATPLWRGERYRHDRIRVAYLSADFRSHPLAFLLAGLFEKHDRQGFEVFGYSFGPTDQSAYACRIRDGFEHFFEVDGRSDRDVAQSLRDQEVDIAIDLMGPTLLARTGVFAHRPCPLQVNYLGCPATMGTDLMDYIIADAFVIPPGQERDYAEKVARLPDTFQGNDAKRYAPGQMPARADAGLPERGVVFTSINFGHKITPEMFGVWMEILRSVDSSVLWLIAGNAELRGNLQREAQARGVAASRLVFAPLAEYPDHLDRLQLADVFLDTLPFNAGATASDALWCGVPVVTCPGEAFAARMAGSLLHAVGMPELVASSLEEYKALAIRLGSDADELARTKAKLARNRRTHPLFDTDRFCRHIEAAYEAMWQRHQRGEPPADFSVEPIA
jgi:predicted O-linked N-acetylglucosamine transferase (SPINDLY family)